MGRGLKLFFVFDKESLEPEESPSPDVRSLTEAEPFVEPLSGAGSNDLARHIRRE